MRNRKWDDLPKEERTPEAGYREAVRKIEAWLDKPGIVLYLANLNLMEIPSEIRKVVEYPNSFIQDQLIISLKGNSLQSLSLLEGANIRNLVVSDNGISDISALAEVQCWELELGQNEISDLSPLEHLDLGKLDLHNNRVTSLSALQHQSQLRELRLYNNMVADLSPLANLRELEELDLDNNQVRDITPLQQLEHLKYLGLNNNRVADLRPLANLAKLEKLNLNQNLVSSLRPLKRFVRAGRPVLLDDGFFRDDLGVFVSDCPLIDPPVGIIRKGEAAILEYFTNNQSPFSEEATASLNHSPPQISPKVRESVMQFLLDNNLEAGIHLAKNVLPGRSEIVGLRADLNAAEKDFIEGTITSENHQRRIAGIRKRLLNLLGL